MKFLRSLGGAVDAHFSGDARENDRVVVVMDTSPVVKVTGTDRPNGRHTRERMDEPDPRQWEQPVTADTLDSANSDIDKRRFQGAAAETFVDTPNDK